tara:strand:- start:147 stop:293 length:147 start_codon:yes stop_codon:yes gene_type:complete
MTLLTKIYEGKNVTQKSDNNLQETLEKLKKLLIKIKKNMNVYYFEKDF